MSPAQVATALTCHVFGDETGDEKVMFLRKVEEGAAAYAVLCSTVCGTDGADALADHPLSPFSKDDKTLASHQASYHDWLQSVRLSLGLGNSLVPPTSLSSTCGSFYSSARLAAVLSLALRGDRSGGPPVGVTDELYGQSNRGMERIGPETTKLIGYVHSVIVLTVFRFHKRGRTKMGAPADALCQASLANSCWKPHRHCLYQNLVPPIALASASYTLA